MRKTFFLTASLFVLIWLFSIFDERAARRNLGPLGLSQASYLTGCGKELAAHYRSGESPSFQEGVLQKGNLSVEEEMALVLSTPSSKLLVENQTLSDQVAEIDRQVQQLEEMKRGYEAKALRHDDYAERLQFQDRSYLEARRHMELAEENREKAERIQDEIDRLKAEKKRLLEGANQIQVLPSFVEPGL